MNNAIWIILVMVGLGLVWGGRKVLALDKVPEPPFKSRARLSGGVEIREYPALVVARTPMAVPSMGKAANSGFQRVARYLFGGNDRSESMAMTAPVVIEMGAEPSLYFFMPFDKTQDQLPGTSDSLLRVHTLAPRTLAVLGFGGFAGNEDIRGYGLKLRSILEREGWTIIGPLMYLGYNAPWKLIGRRNEVAFEVQSKSS